MSRKSSKNTAKDDANEKNSAAIREFQASIAENKKCFECEQRGPTYVNMTIGSFVCTKCSGMLRGITPPHRIKSISMSTFSTDEVAFLKSRGNLWCSKVWMGLYDKNRSGSLESKDEDALKHHIIQKYEKKSYYVDPNTIQQSLHSATSTNVDLTASGSTSTNTPSSGFIGTTLTQRTQNSSTAYGRPTVSASAKGLPKLNGGISSSLSGIVLPPPTVDPFSSKDDFSKAFGPSAATSDNLQLNQQQQSLFPAAPEKPSTVPLPSSVSPNAVQPPIASSSQSSIAASNNSAQESFANFDAAQFDTIADPWSATKKVQSTPKTPATAAAPAPGVMTPANKGLEQGQRSVQEDKYSALKELDDVFKSTVVLSDGKSTGTSIFGSSPMTNQMTQPDPPSVFGPSPTNIAANGSSGLDNFPTNWGSSGDNNITTAAPIENRGFSPNWAAANWGTQQQPVQTQAVPPKAGPINPFTGASNLTQLNTSPWPTTGTSPVQNVSSASAISAVWPTISNAPPQPATATAGISSNSNAGFFGMNNLSQSNDPFGAAPATNLQKNENNNDLFAKAPFGSEQTHSTINALTQEIFGGVTGTPTQNRGGSTGETLNPWATSSPSMFSPEASSASFRPNPTNPFL